MQETQKSELVFFFLTDYLDEEYVDLDWAESTTAESTMISAAEEQQQEGSGEVGEQQEIDDEDEHEGSSKNEAHLSEIDGSGEFGKKTKKPTSFLQFQLFLLLFLFHGILNLKNALKT